MSVQRDDGSGMATIATTSNTSPPYTDTTVVTSQTYDYQVASVNEGEVGAYSNIVTVTATPTTTSGGGKSNCDSNVFGNNNSLRVYPVMYDVETNEVQVYVYSTCSSVLAKMTTPMQQSVLGLSLEQTLLDDDIAIYSGFLDESEEKFNIVIQNKRHSFDETFYIHDKSIIKKYAGETGYTSEQQGTTLPAIVSRQIDVSSVTINSQGVEQTITEEN
jgi:hypothetical protein